jgi:hypothetical protein
MFELFFTLLICAFGWLAVQTAKGRRKKSKRKTRTSQRLAWIETLFGYPFYIWFCLRFYPALIREEIELTINQNIEPQQITKTFQLSPSGLWLPSNLKV